MFWDLYCFYNLDYGPTVIRERDTYYDVFYILYGSENNSYSFYKGQIEHEYSVKFL